MMNIELKTYIVAFIDLLGFSSMVTHDCETPNGEQKYIESLFECYNDTKSLKGISQNLQLIQFSDSVVFALPYSVENYLSLVDIISDYQYGLLCKGILCRGGFSYGKHFSVEDFLFSHGMIEAYRIESHVAMYPRVVIGSGLLDLVGHNKHNKEKDLISLPIIQENDGLWFINYLSGRSPEDVWAYIKKIIPSGWSEIPSIRKKQIWLIDYYNHVFPDNVNLVVPKFTN